MIYGMFVLKIGRILVIVGNILYVIDIYILFRLLIYDSDFNYVYCFSVFF